METSQKPAEKELPIYCVETEKKELAVTFDAAWGCEDLDEILSILKKHKVKATFFMTGEWVEKYPEAVKKMREAGHDLGNHGDGHKHMNSLSMEQCQQEIQGAHEKVKELTGYEMTLFRPPYGEYNNTVIQAAELCGYYSIQWSIDSLDWKDYGVETMIRTVCEHKSLENGGIILLHNGAKYTKDALDKILTNLETQGYQFVPVSELIYKENYTIDHAGKQKYSVTPNQ